jgi:uncharacterized protein
MAVRRVDAVEEACRLGWDALVHPDDLFHWSGWLCLERDQTNLPPFYLLSGGDEGPAEAGLSCYPLDATSEPWPFMRVDCTLGHLARRHALDLDEETEAAIGALLPTCVCGGRRAPDTRVLTVAGRSEERRRLVDELVEAAEGEARRGGAVSVSFLFVSEADEEVRCVLGRRGYGEFPTANYATLRLRGPSFQSYLAGLSQVRRRQVRRERRRLHQAGVRFAVEPLSEGLIEQIVPLQLEAGRRYGHAYRAEELSHVLMLHHRHCGARAITARSSDGDLRGFATVVERGRRLFALQAGFDYNWQGRLPLYFGVCFYEPIEHAVAIGASGLEYAIESEATKVSRGCDLDRRLGYLKVFDGDVHHVLEPLLRRIGAAAASPSS